MNAICLLPVVSAILLIAMLLVPNRIANARVDWFRRLVTAIAGLQSLLAVGLALAGGLGLLPKLHWTLIDLSGNASLAFSIYLDNLACLMLALVSFVGWSICQYSTRYLDGEATQGRYFRWTAFAIGSVSLMVVSGNLLLFFVAWVMTSTALHQLLLHYQQRPAARRAAWTKFAISRLGDVALIGAIAMLYAQFNTLDLIQLFDAAAIESQQPSGSSPLVGLSAFLLVVGAITKSAQVPFHTWLPLTMETPTPVSALMHAGIVNAGGYLMIRTSPLIALHPWAMTLLVAVGGFTACFAAVVMTTQTSVKKKLAYSTIAQMGFMLLQCGLGAFSVAMLHIIAHSLYKAHAFLSSGSVMQQRAETLGSSKLNAPVSWTKLAIAAIVIAAFVEFSFLLFGINPLNKPGGLLLGGILCLALTHWVGQTLRTGQPVLVVRAMTFTALLSLVYVASFKTVDGLIASSLPTYAAPALPGLLFVAILLGFFGLFVLHTRLSARQASPEHASIESETTWLDHCYIHASNGFYIENYLRRFVGKASFH